MLNQDKVLQGFLTTLIIIVLVLIISWWYHDGKNTIPPKAQTAEHSNK
jgi:hypothetical protein